MRFAFFAKVFSRRTDKQYNGGSMIKALENVKLPIEIKFLTLGELMSLMGFQAVITNATYLQKFDGSETIFFNKDLVNTDIKGPVYLRLLFHEFAHATGHAKRLARMGVVPGPMRSIHRVVVIEELIAERAAQLALTHFGVDVESTRNETTAYIETHLNALLDSGGELTKIEAYRVERDAKAALDFMLKNWFNEVDAMRKMEAA